MPYTTSRRWWTVADAAQLLRVHRDTLYDACASGDFPHQRWDNLIRIPCEALRMTYVPSEEVQTLLRKTFELNLTSDDPDQLQLPLDPSCLIPVRRFRNTGEVIGAWHYEKGRYRGMS